jgi:hypothetical protein
MTSPPRIARIFVAEPVAVNASSIAGCVVDRESTADVNTASRDAIEPFQTAARDRASGATRRSTLSHDQKNVGTLLMS